MFDIEWFGSFFKKILKLVVENGEILAMGTESGAILIQQMKTGKKQILSNLDSRVTAVAFIGNELYSVRSLL